MKTVTATEANQHFSRVLERVESGETVVITKRGKQVAKVTPIAAVDEAREAAKTRLFDRLESQPVLNIPRGTRDELYDD